MPENKSESHKNGLTNTDDDIERILKAEYERTLKMVEDNMDFLLDVSEALMEKSQLSQEEFKEIAEKHMDEKIAIVDAGDALDVPYEEMLNKKLKR